MKNNPVKLMLVVAIATLLVACKSNSKDVASLINDDTQIVKVTTAVEDVHLDDEAMMMAFTECLRDQGIELMDPVVDADGNVDKPEFIEGVEYDKEAMGQAWEVCEYHLEGFTGWGKEEADAGEQVRQLDQYIALATCLREKNHDLDDPTAEMLAVWMGDFKNAIDWDDPDALADYEVCSGESNGEGGKK